MKPRLYKPAGKEKTRNYITVHLPINNTSVAVENTSYSDIYLDTKPVLNKTEKKKNQANHI